MKRGTLLIAFICTLSLLAVGCQASGQAGKQSISKGPIVVASKIDTEGALLGKMIVAMLQANGFEVADKTEFGPTNLVRKALLSGEIDIYPEYTGNGAFFFANSDPQVWKDADRGHELVKTLDFEQNKVVWLKPAPANNTWAIAVRQDLAQAENMATLADFANYVNQGKPVKMAASEEFINSPAALPAFQKTYGFSLRKEQLLALAGGNTSLTEKAAADRTDGVNFAMAYGTDGSLAALKLLILQDTLGVQPVYEPAPIIRSVTLERYPEIAGILEPVFTSLDLVTLQGLNAQIALEGRQASEVAREYLLAKGFLKN